ESRHPRRRVTAADRDARRIGGRRRAERERAFSLEPERFVTFRRHAPHRALARRQRDGAEHAAPADRERDVHGPVLAKLTELASAVEWSDDPHGLLLETRARVGGLLAQYSVVGVAAAHETLEESVRRLIADVGEHVVLPPTARAQREHALTRRARGRD